MLFISEKDIIPAIDSLPWTNAGARAIVLFYNAVENNVTDYPSWMKLGLVLFEGNQLNECSQALSRVLALNPDDTYRFAALTWHGHLSDLMGKREAAMSYYREALRWVGTNSMCHSQFKICLSRSYIEERLKEPFT